MSTQPAVPKAYIKRIFVEHPLFAQILMVIFVLGAIAVGSSTTNAFLLVSASIIYEDILVKVFKATPHRKVSVIQPDMI